MNIKTGDIVEKEPQRLRKTLVDEPSNLRNSKTTRGDIVTLKDGAYDHSDIDAGYPDWRDEYVVQSVKGHQLSVFPNCFTTAHRYGYDYDAHVDWEGAWSEPPFVQLVEIDQIIDTVETNSEKQPEVGDRVLFDSAGWDECWEGVVDAVVETGDDEDNNEKRLFEIHADRPFDHAYGAGVEHFDDVVDRQEIIVIDSSERHFYRKCECGGTYDGLLRFQRKVAREKRQAEHRPLNVRALSILVGAITLSVLLLYLIDFLR